MGKLTKLIKTTGWITVGITAIAVEQTVKAGKHIHNEVKSGRPQDLVRKHCKSIKDKMSTAEQRGKDTNLHDKAMEELQGIADMFKSSANKA
jgi:hypothetical protein|tara:strand:+ start:476 stop:751 length:276 start_codon:yes stop_codon:yes gene_type:complete